MSDLRLRLPIGVARLLCIAAVLAATALAACDDNSSSGGSPATGTGDANSDAPVDTTKTTLRVGFGQEPPTWDFFANEATAIRQVLGLNVVESLLEQTDDGKLVPLLASKYEVSDDGREYDFTIREATFHDGSPLTSADVVYSLEQQQTAPDPPAALDQVKNIEAPDARTVRVTLKRPSQAFLGGMAADAGLIIKKGTADRLKKGAIGTGPFVFTSYRQGVGLKLERYDDYWGEKPVLKTVDIRYIVDPQSLVNQFKAGQLDVIDAPVGSPLTTALEADSRFRVHKLQAGIEVYLALNGRDPVFKDQRVREAIARVIDRKAMIDATLAGVGTPICVIASPGEPGFTKECPYEYDPERAKQLMEEAGVKNLSLDLKNVREFGTEAPNLIRSFLEQIGVDVKFVPRDFPVYMEELLGSNPSYQFTFFSGPQPIDSWRCPGWFLETCDPRVDDLLDKADAARSRDEYESLRRQALLQHAKDAYLIPIDSWNIPVATDPAIAGIQPTVIPMNEFDLRGVHWTKE